MMGMMPGLFAWMGMWWAQYPADLALREQSFEAMLDNDLPVFAPSGFRNYFGNKLRIQLLFTIVPVMLILCVHDLQAILLNVLRHHGAGGQLGISGQISDTAEGVMSIISAQIVILFSPLLLRRVLHTEPLPTSPLRERLEVMSKSSGIRYREILLWRTHNNTGNAAVMGILPQVRYVMLSDLLLETMSDDQIAAVFAHELGHVKHRHILWYVVFFIAVLCRILCRGDGAGSIVDSERFGRADVSAWIRAGIWRIVLAGVWIPEPKVRTAGGCVRSTGNGAVVVGGGGTWRECIFVSAGAGCGGEQHFSDEPELDTRKHCQSHAIYSRNEWRSGIDR